MSFRSVLLVVLAVTCGASAVVGVNYLRPSDAQGAAQAKATSPVVVAAVAISRGETITADDVTVRQWPKNRLPEGILTDAKGAIERVAKSSFFPGEPLFEKKLGDRGGLDALIPPGFRAYTIQAKAVAANVAGFVLPGSRVDVLLHLKGQADDDSGGGSTTTLLQLVEVLAVGQALDAPDEKRVSDVQSVTLLVTPDQAADLDLGQAVGTLSLSLRNPTDTAEAKTTPAILKDIRYAERKPVLVAPEGEKVEVPAVGQAEPEPEFHEIVTLRGPHRGQLTVIHFPKPGPRSAKASSGSKVRGFPKQ